MTDYIIFIYKYLPFNLILGFFDIRYPNIITITILRLLRIIAIKKLLSLLEKFEIFTKNQSLIMFIFKAILIGFLLWHWTTCAWFFINYRIENDLYELTWLKNFNILQRTYGQQYLLSTYFVIKIVTGVG